MRTQKINSDSSGCVSSHELPVTREIPVFISAYFKTNRIQFCIWGERVDFGDPETCLLLVMPMGCPKKRSCLCSLASVCDSGTAVVPIPSPAYLFPQFSGHIWAVSLFRNMIYCQFFLFSPHHPLALPCSLIRQKWAISPLHTPLGWL